MISTEDDESSRASTAPVSESEAPVVAADLAARLERLIQRHTECPCCYVSDTVRSEGHSFRGLVHLLFGMRDAWRQLFALSKLGAPIRRTDAARAQLVATLASAGITSDPAELNDGLRVHVLGEDFATEIEPEVAIARRDWPTICPGVDWVLRAAGLYILGEEGANAELFFKATIRPTTVFLYELAYRRRESPAAAAETTLRSLEREYANYRKSDTLLVALAIKFGVATPSTARLLDECFRHMTPRQSNPETHFCLDLPRLVQHGTTAIICGVRDKTMTLEQAEYRFCALLRRPACGVSFSDYLWPARTGVHVPGTVVWRNGTPHLVNPGAHLDDDYNSAPLTLFPNESSPRPLGPTSYNNTLVNFFEDDTDARKPPFCSPFSSPSAFTN